MMLQRIPLLLSIAALLVLPLLTQSSYFHHLLVLWMLWGIVSAA